MEQGRNSTHNDAPEVKSPEQAGRAPKWVATSFTNLVRYTPSGTYFARIRVNGKLIKKSLKTQVLSVAKLRLSDFEKAERLKGKGTSPISSGKMLMEGVTNQLEATINADSSLKRLTKSYYQQRLEALFRSWPGLSKREVRSVTQAECIAWGNRFSRETCATAFNNTVGVLRRLFQIAIESGYRSENPAIAIKRKSVSPKKLTLPTVSQFSAFITSIENAGGAVSGCCADLVRFLAYGGFRKSEAANITWGDVNREKGTIRVSGDPEQGTKSGLIRFVPIIDDMAALLDRLEELQPYRKETDRVMQVKECQKAMDRAAKEVGMQRITHHDLRHLFATRCIESGVDIPTVSRWLGHQDGGALAMKVYGHLRDDHSKEMAKKVSFSAPAGTETPKPTSTVPGDASASPKRRARRPANTLPAPADE